MRVSFTERFRRSYGDAPVKVRRAFDKQLRDLRHPSLRAKKYDAARDIWQARVDGGWRFYSRIDDDTYIPLDVIAHRK
jgi:hypothetical protein